ncbi:hypothetical protein [Methylobacterium sp. CM6257]
MLQFFIDISDGAAGRDDAACPPRDRAVRRDAAGCPVPAASRLDASDRRREAGSQGAGAAEI